MAAVGRGLRGADIAMLVMRGSRSLGGAGLVPAGSWRREGAGLRRRRGWGCGWSPGEPPARSGELSEGTAAPR